MNVTAITSVDHKSTATNSSVLRLALSAERELHARMSLTTVPFANVLRGTSARLSESADLSATEMSIAQDHDQLATMEFARTLAMVHVVLVRTAISVA